MSKLNPGPHEAPGPRVLSANGALSAGIRHWGRLAWLALQDATAPESQLIASSIGYYTLFSLFPLTLLAFALASIWLDPLLAEMRVISELEFIVPGLEELLGENLQNIANARGAVTGISVIMLIWSASSMFNVLTRSMDRIWGADINHRRSIWRHRTLAVFMVLLITLLLLVASTVEGTILTILNTLLPDALADIGPYTTRFWAVLLNIVLFSLLYNFLPHVKMNWREVLPGAIMAGFLWQGAKYVFLYFVANFLSRSNLVYGSFGTIIAFLTWTYSSSLILLYGAYLNRHAAAARHLAEAEDEPE